MTKESIAAFEALVMSGVTVEIRGGVNYCVEWRGMGDRCEESCATNLDGALVECWEAVKAGTAALGGEGEVKETITAAQFIRSQGKTGKGRTRNTRGVMNGLERAYAARLDVAKAVGEVLWFEFEAVKFKLADGAYYTPDFCVMLADCSIEFHECKGWMERAAHVRIKCAADKFPFRFYLCRRRIVKGITNWSIEEVGVTPTP